jgi:hypothetical protein
VRGSEPLDDLVSGHDWRVDMFGSPEPLSLDDLHMLADGALAATRNLELAIDAYGNRRGWIVAPESSVW